MKTVCFGSTFGTVIKSRVLKDFKNYRYSFNSKEKLDEINGDGNSYDYGARVYDPRIGKFLSVDPLYKSFAYYSPYQFAGNKPIWAIDLDGFEEYKITGNTLKITAVIGVVRAGDPALSANKNYTSAHGVLDIKKMNEDIQKVYPETAIHLSENEAKSYGFSPNKEGVYKVQFDITVKELGEGETSDSWLKSDVKNANVMYNSADVSDPARSDVPYPEIQLNTEIFGSGTYEEQGDKVVAKNNSNEKALPLAKGEGKPGKVVGHEFAHWLLKIGNLGHKSDSALDTKNTKVTEEDTKKILNKNKKAIKEQNKK